MGINGRTLNGFWASRGEPESPLSPQNCQCTPARSILLVLILEIMAIGRWYYVCVSPSSYVPFVHYVSEHTDLKSLKMKDILILLGPLP